MKENGERPVEWIKEQSKQQSLSQWSAPGWSKKIWSYLWELEQLEDAYARPRYQQDAGKNDMCWRDYNLPKNTLTELKRNILWSDESRIVLFGSRDHRQFIRWPNTEFKPQYTDDSEAWWHKHHDMELFLIVSGLSYQGSWISLNSLKYLRRPCFLTTKRKCSWNVCFNNSEPKHTSEQQHLGFTPTR